MLRPDWHLLLKGVRVFSGDQKAAARGVQHRYPRLFFTIKMKIWQV